MTTMPKTVHHGTVEAELHYIKAATVSLDIAHEDAIKLAIMLLKATQEDGIISMASVYSNRGKYVSVFTRTTEKKE